MISWPSTLTTVTPPDSLLSLNPIRSLPTSWFSALQRHHCGDLDNIVRGGTTRQVGHGPRQPLQDGTNGNRAPDTLDQLVADVARVEIRKNQHIGPSCHRRARRLPLSHLRTERRIRLELAVAQNVGGQLLKMGGRLLHPGNVGPTRTPLGT